MSPFAALVAAIRPPSTDRRLRAVSMAPSIATAEDVELLLRAHGVAEPGVWAVCDYLVLSDVCPVQVWTWVMEFDGSELACLIASELDSVEVLEHLESLTTLAYDQNTAA